MYLTRLRAASVLLGVPMQSWTKSFSASFSVQSRLRRSLFRRGPRLEFNEACTLMYRRLLFHGRPHDLSGRGNLEGRAARVDQGVQHRVCPSAAGRPGFWRWQTVPMFYASDSALAKN